MRQWRTWQSDPEAFFALAGGGVGAIGVLLSLAGVFPLNGVNALFFTGLFFLGALYRPNWSFLLLIAVLPFETLSVTPAGFGLDLRPYQWLFLILVSALAIRLFSKRTPWPLFSLSPLDGWLGLIPLGAFLSGLFAGGEGMRLASIVLSFYALYLLGRVFLKTSGDVRVALAVLFASGLASAAFGIIQNVAFEQGKLLNVVMPGRPNGTFAEPDWLGFFSAALLLLALSRLHALLRRDPMNGYRIFALAFLSLPIVTALILTVSRSAWLATLVGIATWAGMALFIGGKEVLRPVLQSVQSLAIVFILALIIIVDVPLTRFDLFNRAESTATGLQLITVACEQPTNLPAMIGTLEELADVRCRHINLEERAALQSAGFSIQTTRRLDPNVKIRSEIYAKTWGEIRSHPIFGIGWGNIGAVLGTDENGSAFNASNIWLEIILGAGLLGLLGLAGALGFILYRSVPILLRRESGELADRLPLILSLGVAFLVFNLFNAGLLTGFVWLGFAALPVVLLDHRKKSV